MQVYLPLKPWMSWSLANALLTQATFQLTSNMISDVTANGPLLSLHNQMNEIPRSKKGKIRFLFWKVKRLDLEKGSLFNETHGEMAALLKSNFCLLNTRNCVNEMQIKRILQIRQLYFRLVILLCVLLRHFPMALQKHSSINEENLSRRKHLKMHVSWNTIDLAECLA